MSTLEMLSAAIGARKNSLKALRSRIATILEPIPIGAVLSDENGEVCRISRVYVDRAVDRPCSADWAAMCGERILCVSMYGQTMADVYCNHQSVQLRYLSGKDTRAAAIRLARAIERYMDECAAEKTANDATLSA